MLLDTFHDRRNGYLFYTNPLGALADQAVTDEGNPERRLEPGVGRADRPVRGRLDGRDGHPVQVAALRSGTDQIWGIKLRRVDPAQERVDAPDAVPASTGGLGGIFRVSRAATLVGLDLPPASKNLELKPYGIAR